MKIISVANRLSRVKRWMVGIRNMGVFRMIGRKRLMFRCLAIMMGGGLDFRIRKYVRKLGLDSVKLQVSLSCCNPTTQYKASEPNTITPIKPNSTKPQDPSNPNSNSSSVASMTNISHQ